MEREHFRAALDRDSLDGGGNGFQQRSAISPPALVANGKIFQSGSNQDSQMYDPTTKTFNFVANTIFNRKPRLRHFRCYYP